MAYQASPESRQGDGGIIDADVKYVRVTEIRADGFVAFDFAIGEPEIYVEMLLPQDAFLAFCEAQSVIRLDGEDQNDHADFLWRLRDAARAAAGEPPHSPISDQSRISDQSKRSN